MERPRERESTGRGKAVSALVCWNLVYMGLSGEQKDIRGDGAEAHMGWWVPIALLEVMAALQGWWQLYPGSSRGSRAIAGLERAAG